ncbi:MAG: methionine--tRNA ligase subunit beta, partial [Alicyclobacillaceae bacterium]|nr:methionine--tRNA ligase subunit beta [Alicyclobacillaceae bacterium]
NLIHRTAAMLNRFCGGVLPEPAAFEALEEDLAALARQTVDEYEAHMDGMQFSQALADVWRLVRQANKYIDEAAPWAHNKEGRRDRLGTVLYAVTAAIRVIAVLLQPFMPKAARKVMEQYQFSEEETAWDRLRDFCALRTGRRVTAGEPLFPRLDVEAEVAALDQLTRSGTDREPAQAGAGVAAVSSQDRETIGMDQFNQVALRVGQIRRAERIPGADKLLRLEIDLGTEQRQVVSGIAKHYLPEELIGQKVVVVTNLKPVKLRGVESYGMVLAASAGDQLRLVTVPDDMPNGAVVK